MISTAIRAVLTLALALVVGGGPSPLPARAAEDPPAGFFLAAGGRGLAYRGDLDGALELWHFDLVFRIPKLADRISAAVGIGIVRPTWMWELDYLRSDAGAATEGSRETSALYQAVQITGRQFLFKAWPVHPYFSVGIGVPWLKVRGGAELNGEALDASYIGLEALLGAGAAARIGRSIVVHAGASYRLGGFFYASGEGKGRDITTLAEGYGGPRRGRWLLTSSLGIDVSLGFVF